jgi:uncharacterized protein (TIGR02284 family)
MSAHCDKTEAMMHPLATVTVDQGYRPCRAKESTNFVAARDVRCDGRTPKRGPTHKFARIEASALRFARSWHLTPFIQPGFQECFMDNGSNTGATTALNTLITTVIDSINGYEDSATNIDNERLREIFRERANERQQVVEDLRAEVRRLGGEPEEGGSFLGKAHQRFEDLKAAITGRDEKAIINEVERGEDYLKEKFEAAMASDELTGESRAAVERAYQSVRAGHDQISQLKHGLETSA